LSCSVNLARNQLGFLGFHLTGYRKEGVGGRELGMGGRVWGVGQMGRWGDKGDKGNKGNKGDKGDKEDKLLPVPVASTIAVPHSLHPTPHSPHPKLNEFMKSKQIRVKNLS